MNERMNSIFREYYSNKPFIDRFAAQPAGAVDVIIPVIHTNELWEANLSSFYREIPIHQLLIGDGGCIDDSIEIARKFPRVQVLDHRRFQSLGYSIRKLIEAVETDWFIYVHSDVYLPPGWFDTMQKHQADYDWFGCPMELTIMVQHKGDFGERPWAGSQMGRKRVFEAGLSRIDDDYVYRQEEFVFGDIVRRGGGREGKVADTFHYHQTMHKPTPWARRVSSVNIGVELGRDEEIRACVTQVRGTVKYLQPTRYHINAVGANILRLIELNELDVRELRDWTAETNPVWVPHIRYLTGRYLVIARLRNSLKSLYRKIVS